MGQSPKQAQNRSDHERRSPEATGDEEHKHKQQREQCSADIALSNGERDNLDRMPFRAEEEQQCGSERDPPENSLSPELPAAFQ